MMHISQGSVATHIRCGGIFQYKLVANLLESIGEKNVENQLTFGEVIGKSFGDQYGDSGP